MINNGPRRKLVCSLNVSGFVIESLTNIKTSWSMGLGPKYKRCKQNDRLVLESVMNFQRT